MIKLAVVAHTQVLRVGLRALIETVSEFESAEEGIRIVFEADSLAEIDFFAQEIDVLLLAGGLSPVEMNQLNGIQEGRLAVLLLTDTTGMVGRNLQVVRALARLPVRAWGVLSMEATSEELAAAVHALHLGLLVGEPALVEREFSRLLSAEVQEIEPLAEPLTEREGEVLQLLAQGLANKQIAAALKISEHTVKFHISSIYTKLEVASRTEAVRAGIQRGLVVL